MDKKLHDYLDLVRGRCQPSRDAWGEQIRAALNEGYVRVGWGGRMELLPAGQKALTLPLSNGERP